MADLRAWLNHYTDAARDMELTEAAINLLERVSGPAAQQWTLNGRTQSISAWEREMGLPRGMVRSRETRGWSLEAAILTPSIAGQKRVRLAERDVSNQTRGWHGRFKAA